MPYKITRSPKNHEDGTFAYLCGYGMILQLVRFFELHLVLLDHNYFSFHFRVSD